MAVMGIAGGLALTGTAVAQPINLLVPTPLQPSAGSVIHATPLPPPTIPSAPQAAPAPPQGPALTAQLMPPGNGGPRYGVAASYLETAQAAISDGRFVEAGRALEQAETRLLNDGATASRENVPPAGRALLQVRLARQATAARDRTGALVATGRALAAVQDATSKGYGATMVPAVPPPPTPSLVPQAPPPVPMITQALLPGHWQLSGWQYHWVPPETRFRPVDTRPFVPAHYVWRDGAWVWDAGHYGDE
jgi:hypothetical protein